MIMNWTQESMNANHEYRRDQLRKLASHRIERPARPVDEAGPDAKPHTAHWWSRLRSGAGGTQAA